jgi:hypothetical protein
VGKIDDAKLLVLRSSLPPAVLGAELCPEGFLAPRSAWGFSGELSFLGLGTLAFANGSAAGRSTEGLRRAGRLMPFALDPFNLAPYTNFLPNLAP